MLPLADADTFARRLIDFDPDVLVTQDFHDSQGGFGADTGAKARALLQTYAWSASEYQRCREKLTAALASVYEGEAGFFPPASMVSHH
jgi:hypothetical protein